MRNCKIHVYVKYAQQWNFGGANDGNDSFQTITVTTENKWVNED